MLCRHLRKPAILFGNREVIGEFDKGCLAEKERLILVGSGSLRMEERSWRQKFHELLRFAEKKAGGPHGVKRLFLN